MSFAQTLQQLMDRDGLTNYQLAKALECHQTSVKNWLGGSKPQKLMLKKIADYFGVTTDYLLTGEQKEKAPAETGERAIDDFTYAMYNETKDLPPEKKQMLLDMARFMRSDMER